MDDANKVEAMTQVGAARLEELKKIRGKRALDSCIIGPPPPRCGQVEREMHQKLLDECPKTPPYTQPPVFDFKGVVPPPLKRHSKIWSPPEYKFPDLNAEIEETFKAKVPKVIQTHSLDLCKVIGEGLLPQCPSLVYQRANVVPIQVGNETVLLELEGGYFSLVEGSEGSPTPKLQLILSDKLRLNVKML